MINLDFGQIFSDKVSGQSLDHQTTLHVHERTEHDSRSKPKAIDAEVVALVADDNTKSSGFIGSPDCGIKGCLVSSVWDKWDLEWCFLRPYMSL